MLKIVLADNQTIFRAGAAKVLAVEDDLRVVAQAHSGEQLTMAMERFRPGVLVFASALDIDCDKLIAFAARLKTKLVVVAENGDPSSRYTTKGILGVVYRNVTGNALVECIEQVAKGQTFVQDTLSTATSNDDDLVGARVRDRLTPKELRIVALIVQGFKNKEIALQLGTTEQVIKNYLRNVYDKIGVSDRLELALFTLHHRILAEAAAATATAATAGAGARPN